ncbi:MAG: CBS domain-containing protein [Dehalococcoidia bacterium]
MDAFIASVLEEKGSHVETVDPFATVRSAVRSMNQAQIGSLVVIDERRRPIGIFTERDVLERVVDAGRDPESTRVAEVMTQDLVVIDPSTTVANAMALMTERRTRHLPVLDGGELAGLISIGDVTRWVGLRKDELLTAFEEYVIGRRVSCPTPEGVPLEVAGRPGGLGSPPLVVP